MEPLIWILGSKLTCFYKESTKSFKWKLTVCGVTLYPHFLKCAFLLLSRFGFLQGPGWHVNLFVFFIYTTYRWAWSFLFFIQQPPISLTPLNSFCLQPLFLEGQAEAKSLGRRAKTRGAVACWAMIWVFLKWQHTSTPSSSSSYYLSNP